MSNYYVHFNLHNYIYYGINKASSGNGQPGIAEAQLQQYIVKHNNIITKYQNNSKGKESRIKYLEDFYKKVFDVNNEDKHFIKIREAYMKVSQKYIDDTFQNKAGIIDKERPLFANVDDIDPNSVEAKYRKYLKDISYKGIRSLVQNTEKKAKHYISKINELSLLIQKAKDEIEFKNLMAAQLNAQGITKSLDEILVELQKMNEYFNNLPGGSRILKPEQKITLADGTSIVPFDYLQKLINTLGKLPYWGSQANQQGILGEIAAALYQYEVNREKLEIIEKDLTKELNAKNLFVGSKRKTTTYNSPLSITEHFGPGAIQITSNSTGNHTSKTDVVISYNDNTEMRMSVKNYKEINSKLTLVNGTPLATLLHSLDTTDGFEGHYANLIAPHNRNSLKAGDTNIYKYRADMYRIIQQQALINGFESYDKSSKPTVFIVFGSKKTDVRVYDIETLIGKLLKNKRYFIESSLHSTDADIKENFDSINKISISGNSGEELTENAKSLFQQHKLHVMIKLLK